MGEHGPKKRLALDANLPLDLAAGLDFAHDFRENFQARGGPFTRETPSSTAPVAGDPMTLRDRRLWPAAAALHFLCPPCLHEKGLFRPRWGLTRASTHCSVPILL